MKITSAARYAIFYARGSALKDGFQAFMPEHMFLALIKLSQSEPETIAPTAKNKAEIKAEIDETAKLLSAQAETTEHLAEMLHDKLESRRDCPTDASSQRIDNLYQYALAYAGEPITAPAMLAMLLEHKDLFFLYETGAPVAPYKAPSSAAAKKPLPQNTSDTDARASEKQKTSGFQLPSLPDPNEFDARFLEIDNDTGGRGGSFGETSENLDKPHSPMDDDELPVASSEEFDDDANDDDGFAPSPATDDDAEPKDEPPKRPSRGGIDLFGAYREIHARNSGKDGDEPSDAEPSDAEPSDAEPSDDDDKPFGDDTSDDDEPKRGGIDLFGAYREIHARNGGMGEQPTDKPEKKPDEPHEKHDGGIDFAAAMREMRERREAKARGEKVDDDDDDKTPSEQTQRSDETDDERPREQEKPSGKKQNGGKASVLDDHSTSHGRYTRFNGIRFRGGVGKAAILYALLGSIAVFLIYSILVALAVKHSDTSAVLIALTQALLTMIGFILCKTVLGLIARKRESNARFYETIVASFALYSIVSAFLQTDLIRSSLGYILVKALTCVVILTYIWVMATKIGELPNRNGINILVKNLAFKREGSPDKVYFQTLLTHCTIPIVIATVFWCMNRSFADWFLVYLLLVVWDDFRILPLYRAEAIPSIEKKKRASMSNTVDEPIEKTILKKKNRYALISLQIGMWGLFGIFFFAASRFAWLPLPKWALIPLIIYGVIYVIATLSTLYVSITGTGADLL